MGILNQSWHGDSKVPNTCLHNINIDAEYFVHISYKKAMSAHALAMSSIIKQVFLIVSIQINKCYIFKFNFIYRIIQNLGCPHSCGEGHRGPPANFVRTQCQCLLNRLKQYDKRQFSNYLRHFVKNNSLTFVINFIHSYIGFCTEPMQILSPMCKYKCNKISFIGIVMTYDFGFNSDIDTQQYN